MAARKGNQYAKGNTEGKQPATMGRPLKFRSAMEMQRAIEKYFKDQDEKEKKYTITGLARSLGLCRKQLIEYQDREHFNNVIKGARAIIEEQVEEALVSGKGNAGHIFWLKNQGWSDKQEIELNDISELSRDELIKRVQEKLKNGPAIVKKKAA